MKHPALLNFLIFTCFLVGGYTLSCRFYQVENGKGADRVAYASGSDLVKSMNNGQRSVLLVGVDSLGLSSPKLTSLWLVSYLPADPTLHIIPIFPAGKEAPSSFEEKLPRSFMINGKDADPALGKDFIKLLSDNNYWWSDYLIYDQIALSAMISLFGQAQSSDVHISLSEQLSSKNYHEGDPHEVYSTQLAILQVACHNLDGMIQNSDLFQIGSLVPDHIAIGFDLQQDISEWRALLDGAGDLSCRFPTMEFSWNSN